MSLTAPLLDHHKFCDGLFADAEAAVAAKDWRLSANLMQDLRKELETHFGAEEDILFPAFEATTGVVGGPTQMMAFEHAQMRELMDQMLAALDRHKGDDFAGAAGTLLILMQQHNIKEENILYPMCDQSLSSQVDTLGVALNQRLETACLTKS